MTPEYILDKLNSLDYDFLHNLWKFKEPQTVVGESCTTNLCPLVHAVTEMFYPDSVFVYVTPNYIRVHYLGGTVEVKTKDHPHGRMLRAFISGVDNSDESYADMWSLKPSNPQAVTAAEALTVLESVR